MCKAAIVSSSQDNFCWHNKLSFLWKLYRTLLLFITTMAKQYLQKGRGYAKFLVFFPVHLNLLSLHFVDILLVFSRIRVKSLFVTKFPLAFGKVIENCGLQIIDCCTISQPSENSRQCCHIHLEIFRHYYLSSSLAIQESFISSETLVMFQTAFTKFHRLFSKLGIVLRFFFCYFSSNLIF